MIYIVVVAFSNNEIGVYISGEMDRNINLYTFRNCFTFDEFNIIKNTNTYHKYWSAKNVFIKWIGKRLTIPIEKKV